jgi:plastocyanin
MPSIGLMRPSNSPGAAVALVAVLFLVGACGGDSVEETGVTTTAVVDDTEAETTDQPNVSETDSAVVITVTGLSFPEEVLVPAGKSVTWVNDSSAPHEVQIDTRDGAPVEMEPVRLGMDQEGEVSLEPGTWAYFCTIHPSMTGTLVVEG